MMIGTIIIICNGNHDKMASKVTTLTWLEEWVLYFEVVWGMTNIQWVDIGKTYKMNITLCRAAFDKKLSLVLSCRASWPKYVSYEEDSNLRNDEWNKKYDGKRVIM